MSSTRPHRILAIAAFTTAVSLLSGCSSQSPVAGGSGSTTTNGFTAKLVDSNGAPLTNAQIHVRPDDYYAGDSTLGIPRVATGTISDMFSESDGSISVADLTPGSYTMEAFDPTIKEGIVLRRTVADGPVESLGVVTTQPVGAIHGSLNADLQNPDVLYAVQVIGIERLVTVDQTTGEYFIPDLPPTAYSLRIVSTDSTFTPVVIDTVPVASRDTTHTQFNIAATPYAEYAYTALLVINTTAAGLTENDTIFNFPLLLRLNGQNFDFSTAKRKGTDFRVSRRDSSEVPFEQEWWDSASATAALWLLIDTLSGAAPDTLHLYWGNSKGGLISQPHVVFDTAFGYTGIWHLNESGGQEQIDATPLGHSGIPYNMDGANDIPGLIGRAQMFEAKDSQNIIFSNIFDTSARDGQNDYAYTVSFWMKTVSSTAPLPQGLVYRNDVKTDIQFNSGNLIFFTGALQDNGADTCRTTISSESWTYICGVRKGPYHLLYANGELVDSCFSLSRQYFGSSGFEGTGSLYLGSLGENTGWFDGTIDELRWSRRPQSATWIRLCYETQRENQTVISITGVEKRL